MSKGIADFVLVAKKQGISSHFCMLISKSFTPCSKRKSLLLIKNSFPKGIFEYDILGPSCATNSSTFEVKLTGINNILDKICLKI